ncbi:Holliday junction DNA helicase RuvB [Candidatus Peribacteria bacterium RIFOXYC2_FULL_55_14]|nr:MAG: Holliday junction ATP-dependent DNA helicase RuvB [Candidatus Peribacteria bacterium GW2011_GWB1_54_5]KKW39927.1 MAG: Holliday junction ATP-dependent DNA helicase RuvB [Candidatus Peribacteria bacterium GW2011_GWC2_54_8]KKW44201.1 MAG: Holliday junction ATP-dependent DNA helicase RuvB [Candidatus Peregrinibacteria bacterium GW2011_GWA2_54_9]OGJ71892.1 MAG: Holliday junction DNA helicase RuvB [Candidatus Peribacteria bacterium RIFOXYA1_FULL_56_14]OGJ72763.1 MAG: Holliday junction DNA hel
MAISRTQKAEAIVRPTKAGKDADVFEQSLRPRTFAEYVGQSRIKGHLLVHIEAARKRNEPLGHTLLHGPPGLGKTTLAHIMAREMGTQLRITSGPAIEKPGDLASLLTNIEQGDVLFIDEIHRMRPIIEEVLYSAMEEFALDLVIGKGPTARSMRLDLKPFTLVGATTKAGSMSAPLRDRFVHTFKLSFYSPVEMERIIERSAGILKVELEEGVADYLSGCCRATPRVANRLVRAVRDFAQVQNEKRISHERALSTLVSLGIDERGLDETDREILRSLVEKFGGGPVGLSTLATTIAEEEDTLEDVYEPYLIQQGYLQRTSKGRMVTPLTYEALNLRSPDPLQPLFS